MNPYRAIAFYLLFIGFISLGGFFWLTEPIVVSTDNVPCYDSYHNMVVDQVCIRENTKKPWYASLGTFIGVFFGMYFFWCTLEEAVYIKNG